MARDITPGIEGYTPAHSPCGPVALGKAIWCPCESGYPVPSPDNNCPNCHGLGTIPAPTTTTKEPAMKRPIANAIEVEQAIAEGYELQPNGSYKRPARKDNSIARFARLKLIHVDDDAPAPLPIAQHAPPEALPVATHYQQRIELDAAAPIIVRLENELAIANAAIDTLRAERDEARTEAMGADQELIALRLDLANQRADAARQVHAMGQHNAAQKQVIADLERSITHATDAPAVAPIAAELVAVMAANSATTTAKPRKSRKPARTPATAPAAGTVPSFAYHV